MADHFTETQIPQQKFYKAVPFPAVVSPKPPPTPCSLSHLTETIKSQKPFLESLLLKSGALLLRGYDVKTAKDFNEVVEAFGYEELSYKDARGTAVRTRVIGRIFTANESSPDIKIPFHHEFMAQAPEPPSKLFLFCEVPPTSGGETPIALSRVVYERMKLQYPEFVENLEKRGLLYSQVLPEGDDNECMIGRGWKTCFSTEDKNVAEERAAEVGIKLEWLEGGAVKRVTGPASAIRYDKSRQQKVMFINTMSWDKAGYGPHLTITFGDGTSLPADGCNECLRILEEECVDIRWQEGDILLLDNWAVLHGRRPTNSPRRLLASICK